MMGSRNIRYTYTNTDRQDESIVFSFDAFDMNAQEMFMQWVRFMNAIGYVLDIQEMEEMWNDR